MSYADLEAKLITTKKSFNEEFKARLNKEETLSHDLYDLLYDLNQNITKTLDSYNEIILNYVKEK